MKRIVALLILSAIGFTGCSSWRPEAVKPALDGPGEPFVIEGEVTGLRDGIISISNAWDNWTPLPTGNNRWEKIAEGRVRDGRFRIEGRVETPVHVYLYCSCFKGRKKRYSEQVRDFILEPGIISVNGDLEKDAYKGVSGTPLNDARNALSEALNDPNSDKAALLSAAFARRDALSLRAVTATLDRSEYVPADVLLAALDSLPEAYRKMNHTQELYKNIPEYAKTSPNRDGTGENPLYIDIVQPDMDGEPLSLKSIVEAAGTRYVLLDFWATWCGPCIEDIPGLLALYRDYHEKGFDIYSVSLDTDLKRWRNYVRSSEMTWHHVCDGSYTKMQAWADYACRGVPTTVLIEAATGQIIARDLRSDELRERLSGLL